MAMYFTIGGRGIASELYRVTYTGKESTAKADYKDAQNADLRQLRHDLEAFHRPGGDAAKAIALAIPNLKHEDRFIRYAARVTLEHQPLNQWKDLVLAEKDPTALINGAIALARKGGSANQADLLVALDKLDLAKLPVSEQTDLVRVYQLIFIRMGEASPEWAEKLAKKWDPLYPAASDALNRELVQLLVYVKSPTVLAKTIELMKKPSKPISRAEIDELIARNKGYGAAIEKMMKNAPDDQKTHYAFALRNVEKGWTMEQRKFFFEWLNEARQKSGGNSYIGFINFIDNDTYNLATDVERVAIEAAKLRKPYVPKELPKPKGPGKKWTTEEILKLIEKPLTGRNFVNGQKMYSAARCVVCHRFAGEGGATGPDLSQLAGRFNNKDLTEALIDPSKVISDQYKSLKITTLSGQTYAGRIVSDAGGVYTVLTDPEDSTKIVDIKKDDVESMVDSKVSMMPVGLLDGLSEREVLDLYAYMLSRGDPGHPMFAKQKKK
ncbi:MAG: c-type cytochrome [Zavarzinella sp.]